jgi:hypothetical protein
MNMQFLVTLKPVFLESITADLGPIIASDNMKLVHERAWAALQAHLDQTVAMDSTVRFESVAKSLQSTVIEFCCKITVSRIVLVLCIGARQLVQHSYITNSSNYNIIYIAEVQNIGSTITNQR